MCLSIPYKIKTVKGQQATVQSYDANERAFLSLRNGRIFQGKGNNVEIWPRLLAITNDADNSCTIRIYINGNKTDITNYKFITITSILPTY